jgi:hypothetical protein
MKLSIRRFAIPATLLIAATAALVLPAASSATILVGAESSRELVNSTQTPELQDAALAKMQAQGVQVVRANFRWFEIAAGCAGQSATLLQNPDNPCYDWSHVDGLVSQANARGIQVLLSVQQSPTWANGSVNPYAIPNATGAFQTWVAQFAAFHTAAATRYSAGSAHGFVKYWTVYNEPNSGYYWGGRRSGEANVGWQGKPDPKRYALLYARTAVAIKTASPSAKVAPGPTGPTGGSSKVGGMQPLKFWRGFQQAVGAYLPGSLATKRRYIDAIATNPYPGFASQPSVAAGTNAPDWVTMPTIDRIFRQLDKSPITRGKPVWATEFGWQTSGISSTTAARQAQFIAEAFDWLDSRKRVQIGISYGLSDPALDPPGVDADWQSGTFTFAGLKKPSFFMYQRMVAVAQAGTRNRVKRGTIVRVFGRSNVSPKTGVLAMKLSGSSSWKVVPKQRRAADGTIRASIRITAKLAQFATYDKGNAVTGIPAGYGPTRVFTTF